MSKETPETTNTEEPGTGSTAAPGHTTAQKEPQHHRTAPNTIYRRAILHAFEYSSLHNFNARSNIDAIRRHTKEIVADHDSLNEWNDILFLQTLKSVVNQGDVELMANIQAELSPTYKRKRANSLQKKLEQCQSIASSSMAQAPPELPIVAHPTTTNNTFNLPVAEPHHVIFAFKDPKVPPHRPREHEKWKIIPKRIYDRTTVVNPMETND